MQGWCVYGFIIINSMFMTRIMVLLNSIALLQGLTSPSTCLSEMLRRFIRG